MSATIVEQTRTFHEDVERLERAAVQYLVQEVKNPRDVVKQRHLVNMCLEQIVDRNKQLIDLYKDADNLKKDEVNSIVGSGPSLYTLYYDRLRELKEYHRKFSIESNRPDEIIPSRDDVQLAFTGEESFGRTLDLNFLYDQWVNLPGNTKRNYDYVSYIQIFYEFDGVLDGPEYETYLREVLLYLVDWIHRAYPLFKIEDFLAQFEQDFAKNWAGGVHSWKNDGKPEDHPAADPEGKVYCKYCKKTFAKMTVYMGHLQGKKHQQAANKTSDEKNEKRKATFLTEYKIHQVAELLADVMVATKENVVKKQARTYAENEADIEEEEEEEEVIESDSDEEEEPVRRIKNYPLGWDGKPIPYWLYKLHGLSVEYKCEICGNTSYWGRRNFERHFQEWRHAHGMRCLKIPNTRHFQEITKMADAVELYKKIKEEQSKTAWRPDLEEEFEDAEGNVYNRKTYLELQRQGII